jgi:hypothetical protein
MVDEIAAAAATGISHGICHKILSDDLNMSRVTQHIVPHVLTQDQHDDCTSICGDPINSADEGATFLNQIIKGEETWCFLYDPLLKRHSTAWKSPSSPRKKKPRRDKSKGKVMLEMPFESSGTVHMEFIPEGHTVNKNHYKVNLHRLCNSIHCSVLSFGAGRTG